MARRLSLNIWAWWFVLGWWVKELMPYLGFKCDGISLFGEPLSLAQVVKVVKRLKSLDPNFTAHWEHCQNSLVEGYTSAQNTALHSNQPDIGNGEVSMVSDRETEGLAVDVPDARYHGQIPIFRQRHPHPKLETEKCTIPIKSNDATNSEVRGRKKKRKNSAVHWKCLDCLRDAGICRFLQNKWNSWSESPT